MDIPVNVDALERELSSDEGRKKRGYSCPAGFWTIGIGHNTEGKDLSDRAIRTIFEDDVRDAVVDLDATWIGWRGLSENRKRALINFSFQLGFYGMQTFKKFWMAMRAHDFKTAVKEMKDSKWYTQTQSSRTSRVLLQIEEG